MPINKATGPDLDIAEAMKTASKRQAEFLANLWRTVGRTGLFPTQWTKCTIVPVYKKGDATKPSNHRPIALLSHSRKVIEKSMDNSVRPEYDFDPVQLGFRRHQGTEIAILRAVPPPTLQDDYIAILDLKQAYPSVPKDKLLERCRAELTPNLCHRLEHMLKLTSSQTVRDDSEAVGTLNRRVPQGSLRDHHCTMCSWTHSHAV